MMRELKFRAWLNGRKMIVAQYDFVNGVAYGFGWNIEEGEDESVWETRELEQFTGVHDKEGRSIYVGDILSYSRDCDVRWMVGLDDRRFDLPVGFVFTAFTMKATVPQFLHPAVNTLVIIGNTHENPELY